MKSKKNKKESKQTKEVSKPKPDTVQQDEDKPFDFGGLPQRDLKKNLGCG